jgi:hypothetical protein
MNEYAISIIDLSVWRWDAEIGEYLPHHAATGGDPLQYPERFVVFESGIDLSQCTPAEHGHVVQMFREQYNALRLALAELRQLDENGWCTLTDGSMSGTLRDQWEETRRAIAMAMQWEEEQDWIDRNNGGLLELR